MKIEIPIEDVRLVIKTLRVEAWFISLGTIWFNGMPQTQNSGPHKTITALRTAADLLEKYCEEQIDEDNQ